MNPALRSAFINPLLPGLLLMVGATGAVGVGAAWARHEISVVANDNRLLETRIAAAERESEQLDAEIAQEQDIHVLLARQAAWKLNLAPPSADRVFDVTEDPLRRFSAKQGGERGGGIVLGGR